MNKIKVFLVLLLSGVIQIAIIAQPYYLSSTEGDDQNSGSIDAPWQTLEKISSVTLNMGDTVYFKSGDRFEGHFVVNGSGSAAEPIVITSFGTGNKPVITGEVGEAGGGDYQEAILVENNDNIIFDGLEIQNERKVTRVGVDSSDAYGINIINSQSGSLSNFTFRNLTVTNVYAIKTVMPEDQQAFNAFTPSGIRIHSSWNTASKIGNVRDVLIENNSFSNLQRLGIHIKHLGGVSSISDSLNRNMNLIVRDNNFSHTGGTCVLPIRSYNCLIENNLFDHPGSSQDPRMTGRGSSVWTWRCINTVIQYNSCLHVRGILDSHGIHIDHECQNTFVQYNYMEDCEGGFVEILGGNVNAVYRFNISVNDGWRDNPNWVNSNHTLWINENVPGNTTHYCDSSYIYNNTVYIDMNYATAIDIDAKNTFIYNNIFYTTNGGNIGGKQVVIKNNGTPLFMQNNLFNGQIASAFKDFDASPVLGPPNFSNPGSGSAEGYQLNVPSAAVNTGIALNGPVVPEAGSGVFENVQPFPTVDIYGNPVDMSSGTPNIGACNAKDGVNSSNNLGFAKPGIYSIYPNPAKDSLFLQGLEGENVVEIINVSGEIVKRVTITGSLDISDLGQGYYLLRIKGYLSKPFIVNR